MTATLTNRFTAIGTLEDAVRFERGTIDRRYNIYDGDTRLGWVIRDFDGPGWIAFVSADVTCYTRGAASQISRQYARQVWGRTRREAVGELLAYLVIRAGYTPENDR